MEIALSVAGLIAIIVFIVLCVFAINALRRVGDLMLDVSSALDETKRLAAELHRSLPETLTSLQGTSSRMCITLQNVDTQLENLGEGIGQFKQIGSRLNDLESRLHGKIEGPLMQAANVVSGVSKAINTFVNGINRR